MRARRVAGGPEPFHVEHPAVLDAHEHKGTVAGGRESLDLPRHVGGSTGGNPDGAHSRMPTVNSKA